MTDILIADTLGANLTPVFMNLLPHVEMRGHSMPGASFSTHPHGAWCGYLAGIPLEARALVDGTPGRIDFVRIFDGDAGSIPGGMEFLLDKIAELRPRVVSRSWGAWDQDDAVWERYLPDVWTQFIADYQTLQKEIGFLDFAAAGNSDRNDPDGDLDFPQRLMCSSSFIIGSTDREGIPSVFSGDGVGGACVCVGERVLSPDLEGKWCLWNGTSAACPKMAGVAAAGAFTFAGFLAHIQGTATFPRGYERPHPKWFWGNCEDLWQAYARETSKTSWPGPDFDLNLNFFSQVF